MITLPYASADAAHVARIKAIGEQQRQLTILVLGLVLLHAFVAAFLMFVIVAIPIVTAICVTVNRLMIAMGLSLRIRIAALCGMFLPLVNIIILVALNVQACNILRAAGLRVGLIGVEENELNRFGQE